MYCTRIFVVLLLLSPLGCGDAPRDQIQDASVITFDAQSIMRDASVRDARPFDSGPGRYDAGRPFDSGRPVDAGPICEGDYILCSLQVGSGCALTLGCDDDSECRGFATSCSYHRFSFSCNSQEGCYWNSFDERCSGVARSCRRFSSSFSCRRQDGCRWEERCSGEARQCRTLSEDLCTVQSRCRLSR